MKKNHPKATDKGSRSMGFTLIEVLMAMAIFSVGLLGAVSMQLAASRNNTNSRFSTEASVLASHFAERLMHESYTDLASGVPNPPIEPYAISWTVTPVDIDVDPPVENPAVDEDDMKNISVTVQWTGRGGGTRQITYASAKARETK